MSFHTWQLDDCDKPDWDRIESALIELSENMVWLLEELTTPVLAQGQWLATNQDALEIKLFRPVLKHVKSLASNTYDSSQPLLTYLISGLAELQSSVAGISAAIVAAGMKPPNIVDMFNEAKASRHVAVESLPFIPGIVYPEPPGITPLPTAYVGGGVYIDPTTGGPVSTTERPVSNAGRTGTAGRNERGSNDDGGAFARFSFDDAAQDGTKDPMPLGDTTPVDGKSVDTDGVRATAEDARQTTCARYVSEQAYRQLSDCLIAVMQSEQTSPAVLLSTVADILGQSRPGDSGTGDADLDHPHVLKFAERGERWHQQMRDFYGRGMDVFLQSPTLPEYINTSQKLLAGISPPPTPIDPSGRP